MVNVHKIIISHVDTLKVRMNKEEARWTYTSTENCPLVSRLIDCVIYQIILKKIEGDNVKEIYPDR